MEGLIELHDNIRKMGLYTNKLKKAHIITSCRKFDVFGDWFFLKVCLNPLNTYRALRGTTGPLADRLFYEFDNKAGKNKQPHKKS